MTRSELIARLAERFPQLTLKDADACVSEILSAISDNLKSGKRIEIRGFGTFALNFRARRTARNPKTGEKVVVPGKNVPHFKAGKELRERVAQNQAGCNLTQVSEMDRSTARRSANLPGQVTG